MNPSLGALVERARRGDASAFDEIVVAFESGLVRFVASLLGGDVHAAHDVVQDVFVAAWRSLDELANPLHLRAWLYRVAYRRGISWMRRRGPKGARFLDIEGPTASGERIVTAIVAREPTPEGACVRAEGLPRLRAVLASLPPRYAAPAALYYLEERSLRDTALLLGIPLPTLKMRLHRARRLLRSWLGADAEWRLPRPAAKRGGGGAGRDAASRTSVPCPALDPSPGRIPSEGGARTPPRPASGSLPPPTTLPTPPPCGAPEAFP